MNASPAYAKKPGAEFAPSANGDLILSLPMHWLALERQFKIARFVPYIMVASGLVVSFSFLTIYSFSSHGLMLAGITGVINLSVAFFIQRKLVADQERKLAQATLTKGREIILNPRSLKIASAILLRQARRSKEVEPYCEIPWSEIAEWNFVDLSKRGGRAFEIITKSEKNKLYILNAYLAEQEPLLLNYAREQLAKFAQTPDEALLSKQHLLDQQNDRRIKLILGLGLGAAIVTTTVFLAFHSFVHPWSATLTLLIYASIISFPIRAILQSRFHSKSLQKKSALEQFAILQLPIIGLATIAGIFANVLLDKSNAEHFDLTIELKSYTTSKNQSRRYYVLASPPLQDTKYVLFLNESTKFSVGEREYGQARAGETKISAFIQKGFLGIPHIVSHKLELTPPSAPSAPGATSEAIEEAKRWQAEAFAIPAPEAYREDSWPNGKPRTKEPLVKGVVHGWGDYFFANGQRYSRIPWKNGQKHGRFQLYRESGMIEGDYSYKNGQPHGYMRWYDEAGKLKTEILYVDGVPQQNSP